LPDCRGRSGSGILFAEDPLFFFPIILPVGHDARVSRLPWFAFGVIGLTVLVQLWSTAAYWYRLRGVAVPDPITVGGYVPLTGLHPTLLLSAFVHGGWLHLASNLLFLYVTAFNLEDRWGWAVFGPFYLGGAVCSALAFGAVHPTSTVPLVGASGAVAGAMGAFLVCFSRARLRLWYFWWLLPPIRQFLYTGTFLARASIALPVWFGMELLFALFEGGSNVAHSAHVGGFAYGVAFAVLLRATGMDARRWAMEEQRSEVFVEEPGYLAALDHLDRGDAAAARSRLEEVLGRGEHLEARLALVGILASQGEERPAADHASRALLELCGRDPARALSFFHELSAAHPRLILAEAALGRVARTAVARGELREAFDALRRLLLCHPEGAEVPRALWEAAELQRALERPDLAHTTLENLRAVYPESSFATLAERKLAELTPHRDGDAATRSSAR
jgi:membrane associated rhomboid family serine protease